MRVLLLGMLVQVLYPSRHPSPVAIDGIVVDPDGCAGEGIARFYVEEGATVAVAAPDAAARASGAMQIRQR